MIIGKQTSMTLKRVTLTADTMSAATTETWTTVATVKGTLAVVSGSERLRSDRIAVEGDYRFYTKYVSTNAITEKDRFVYGSRTFEITFVNNMLEANKDMVISLREIK